MNPFLATDGYKTGHHIMYPDNTTLVYSNFTPRSNKYAPKGCDKVVVFGTQMTMIIIKEMFDKHFFKRKYIENEHDRIVNHWQGDLDVEKEVSKRVKKEVCQEIKKEYSMYLDTDYDVSHIEELWDLGYLPIEVKSLPEGTLAPIGVPVLTIKNTEPEFYWLPNFLETLLSNLLWKPMTSATIAHQYRKNLIKWASKTDRENMSFVDFQGHDFSARGLDSMEAVISSGLGHATSFLGSDSLPVIHGARKYYGETGFVVGSVPATEHSVMCAGSKDDEIGTFRRLLNLYPKGILSVVSDTWDLWKVLTVYLPELKEEILARDGKLVIRPDSGDPVDILCGTLQNYQDITKNFPEGDVLPEYFEDYLLEEVREKTPHGEIGDEEYTQNYLVRDKLYEVTIHNISWNRYDKQYYFIDMYEKAKITMKEIEIKPSDKGVIELLWDVFGGTINEQGYKVLDPHIGAIYGDSITIDRAEEICKRLEAKGFASTNVVMGVGSFTYQFNTRDTFGFAMKATYVEIEQSSYEGLSPEALEPRQWTEGREIFKDPITDDGTKKSAKGLLMVGELEDGTYELHDQVDWEDEEKGALQTIFKDGKFYNKTTLTEIRQRLRNGEV